MRRMYDGMMISRDPSFMRSRPLAVRLKPLTRWSILKQLLSRKRRMLQERETSFISLLHDTKGMVTVRLAPKPFNSSLQHLNHGSCKTDEPVDRSI